MRTLILGSVPAAALGLLLGGMARPELAIEEPRPMEPAQVAYFAASYEPPPYVASAPSHVLGTDWTWNRRDVFASSYVEPEPVADDVDFAEHAYFSPSPNEAAVHEPSYPSVDGDILAGVGPAEPPVMEPASPDA